MALKAKRKFYKNNPLKNKFLRGLFCYINSIVLYSIKFNWLGWKDSNLRVPESESSALPLGYTPIKTNNLL
jgi:hypothetical protein